MRSHILFSAVAAILLAGCSSETSSADVVPADSAIADLTVPDGTGDALPETAGELPVDPPVATIPLLPGPGQEGFDAELEKLARLYDRQFWAFNAFPSAANQDLSVDPAQEANREAIRAFLQDGDGWDFEAESSLKQVDVVTSWHKVAGLYGGVGMAADAYRYGVLRDQGYDAAEVDRAREFLLQVLDSLHLATAITGVPGVIARGFIRTDVPGDGQHETLLPLFDEAGDPLPEVKNNGAWRADNSGGLFPEYIWEDSCSRDQYIGWVAAAGAAWEVIKDDDSIPQDYKDRLQADARELGHALMVVRESGYDLELPDADGRTTLHGYMNEQCIDSNVYIPGLRNGFHAAMALGSVATWAYVSEDPELKTFLYDDLIATRQLDMMPAEDLGPVNTGVGTNFSNFNMAFQGIWLALRYVDSPAATSRLRQGLDKKLYDNGGKRQPREQKQSLFDYVYAAGMAGSSAFGPMDRDLIDATALANGTQTLSEFPQPPFWEFAVANCTPEELAAKKCEALNGMELDVIGEDGWKGTLVCEQVIPMAIRPPSNYFWRSDPYKPNGSGNGSRLIPGVDFRYAYWLGRWAR
jgi:hypothetical protein